MRAVGLAGVLAGYAIAAAWLQPFQPAPFVDDWVYAWSVENLLSTGRLEVLDFSSNLVYAQTLWGALFCLPFGFSFAALRVSTWVLSLVALVGVHRLLTDNGASPGAATLGAATLATYPPFAMLSFSFMTDVPLLALEVWTLVYLQRAWQRSSTIKLWIGTALAVIASAIRTVGLVPALAASAALLFDRPQWGRARGRFLIPLSAVAAAAALAWYQQDRIHEVANLTYTTNTPEPRLVALREYGLMLLPAWLPLSIEFMAVGTGLALAPVALAVGWPTGRQRRHALAAGAAGVGLVIAGHFTGGLHNPVFSSEGSWVSDELGAVVTLLPGWTPLVTDPIVIVALTLACWASFCTIAASSVRAEVTAGSSPVHWWTLGGLVLMTALLWLTTDRYILPFVPPALTLALGHGARVSWARASVLLAAFALVGVIGVRDRLAAEEAVWTAVNDLRLRGVPVADIDAGYAVNGWLQYAHPNQAPVDSNGSVDVPFVNGDAELPWMVAVATLPGTEIVREYPFARTWREPGSILVLRRAAASSAP